MKIQRAKHIQLGMRGERIAANLLQLKGYDILGRDIHFKSAQVDIAAMDGDTFVIAEVKTLRVKKTVQLKYRPADNLSDSQINRLRAARREMMKKFKTEAPLRFDVIEIYMGKFYPLKIKHTESFFSAEVQNKFLN